MKKYTTAIALAATQNRGPVNRGPVAYARGSAFRDRRKFITLLTTASSAA